MHIIRQEGDFPIMTQNEISPLERAMRLLSRRAYSERELRLRLLRCEYSAAAVRETVKLCRKRGYLDDALLAHDGAADLSARGDGARRIRQKLQRRGLPPELIAAALEENAPNEPAAAQRALEYKLRLLRRETDPRKKREKAFRFLAGRGFSADVIRDALDRLLPPASPSLDEEP